MAEKLNVEQMLAALGPAAAAAEQMRNHFRTFGESLEVFRKGQSVLQGLKEAETHRDTVTKEVRALEDRSTVLQREVEGHQQAAKDAKVQADREIATAKQRTAEVTATLRQDVTRTKAEAKAETDAAQARLTAAREAQGEALAPLEKERAALQAKVDGLKAELANLVKKYQG